MKDGSALLSAEAGIPLTIYPGSQVDCFEEIIATSIMDDSSSLRNG